METMTRQAAALANIGGENLINMYVRAMIYAMIEASPSKVRKSHATDAVTYRTELQRRAATGDTRYTQFAA